MTIMRFVPILRPIQGLLPRGTVIAALGFALATGMDPALAGEKMIEAAPSKPGTKLTPTAPALDPVLDHILNPGKQGSSSFNPGAPNIAPAAPSTPGMDPAIQKRWSIQLDKRRNWLLENAATLNSQQDPRLENDYPRFSQPGNQLGQSRFGERYLRATESAASPDRNPSARPGSQQGAEGEIDPLTGLPRQSDTPGSAGSLAPGTANTVPFLSRDPVPDTRGLSAFSDKGRFSAPTTTVGEFGRRTPAEDRASSFERLLSGSTATGNPSNPANPGGETTPLSPFGLTRSTSSRSQQFQTLLAGPEAPRPPAASTLGTSAFGTSAFGASPAAPGAVRNGLTALPDRTLSPSALPGATPIPPRPAPPKFEPRPALLPIPTRGF